jgi:hypothetical protein
MSLLKCQAGVTSGCSSRSSMARSGSLFRVRSLLSSDRSGAVFTDLFYFHKSKNQAHLCSFSNPGTNTDLPFVQLHDLPAQT